MLSYIMLGKTMSTNWQTLSGYGTLPFWMFRHQTTNKYSQYRKLQTFRQVAKCPGK